MQCAKISYSLYSHKGLYPSVGGEVALLQHSILTSGFARQKLSDCLLASMKNNIASGNIDNNIFWHNDIMGTYFFFHLIFLRHLLV